jgi:hypothetical protein
VAATGTLFSYVSAKIAIVFRCNCVLSPGFIYFFLWIVIHMLKCMYYTGHTQKNGAVSNLKPFDTAPFFCVCPVY